MSRANTPAEGILAAMAYDREQFKDCVEEKFGGPFLGNAANFPNGARRYRCSCAKLERLAIN